MAPQRPRQVPVRATDPPRLPARPKARGVRRTSRRRDARGLFQPFPSGPNGVKVEPNLDGAEAGAAGIAPAPMAGDLPR
jgi:hypothetical protein